MRSGLDQCAWFALSYGTQAGSLNVLSILDEKARLSIQMLTEIYVAGHDPVEVHLSPKHPVEASCRLKADPYI